MLESRLAELTAAVEALTQRIASLASSEPAVKHSVQVAAPAPEPETVEEAPAVEPEAPEPEPEPQAPKKRGRPKKEPAAPTKAEVREALVALAKATSQEHARGVLQSEGKASTLSELPEALYQDVINACKTMLEEVDE